MSRAAVMRVAGLVSCAVIPLLAGGAVAQERPVFASCEYRFAVIFAGQPMTRDITYTTRTGMSVPARQWVLQQGPDRFSITAVRFPTGPVVDDAHVEHAAASLRQKGEVRFQAEAPYDPGMPGRQLNIFMPNNRQLRASVYMADRHMIITEAEAAVGDFNALQFEQSITLIDDKGQDLDRPNGGAEPRIFPCR